MTSMRAPIAGLLAWIVPGLGHLFLGHRGRGLVCMVAICATFWSGVAIGGVQGTVAPHSRKLWFIAQLGAGTNALAAYALHFIVSPDTARSTRPLASANWVAAEIGMHYTGVAGLLNLLIILDAIALGDKPRPRRRGPPEGVT